MDIIVSPPEVDKYETLKDRILSSFSESKESKLRRMLKGQLLGDMKHSHFLQHLKNLSSHQYDEAILQTLFIEQLLQQVTSTLAANGELSLTKLTSRADQIMELQRPAQIHAVNAEELNQASHSSAYTSQAEIVRHLDALSARFDQTFAESRSRSKVRQQNRSNSNSSSPDNNNKRLCCYHQRFGNQARNCHEPCAWISVIDQAEN